MAKKTSGLTVKGRIYGGFVFLIFFLCALAVMNYFGLVKIGSNVGESSRVTNNTMRVLTIERNVVGLRRNVLVYTGAEGDDKALTRIRDLQAQLRKDLTDAIAATRNPDRKALLEKTQAAYERYSANFEKLVELRTRRDKTRDDTLFPIGSTMRTQLTQILDSATAAGNWEVAAVTGKAQEQLMLARLNANRFLAIPSPKLADSTRAQIAVATDALRQLIERAKIPQNRMAAEAVLQQLPTYSDSFEKVATATFEMDRIINKENAALAAELGDDTAKIKAQEVDILNKLQEATESTISFQITLSGALSFAAIVLGLLAAYLIARAILVPINNMTQAMGELAGGKLDVTVPALDRTDEIGEMAQAVQVFKQNAVDKQRMEQDAEAARIADAAADAAQRTREAAIVAEVAAVATAASGGDLDRRIDLAGKDGFLLSLCEGVNNLVNLTGVALKDVAGVLSSVARGDLTQRITNQYGGLFGQLKGDVNQTADKLFEIVTNINSSAGQIGSAASEVAAGSQDLSERSEQQASALEETAASMEELAATVRQNASNAQQANQLAAGAREIAASGGQVVSDAVVAMARIETSSQKIEDIVGMIDEIAFQTNLLALNAAVEAARAGDAGKGFAVVAQEVRNLAQRSAQASKEIKTLIAESSTQVRTGADLVKGAGKTLDEILGSVKRVADIVAEIAAASTEQASGIDQVNSAVTQMDEMTQQNAALVEESAAAAHALEDQSAELNRLMGFFHVGDQSLHAAPVAVQSRSPVRAAAKPVVKAKAKPVTSRAKAPTATKDQDWAEF